MAARTSGAITTLRDVCVDHFRHQCCDSGANAVIRLHGARERTSATDDMKRAPCFFYRGDAAQRVQELRGAANSMRKGTRVTTHPCGEPPSDTLEERDELTGGHGLAKLGDTSGKQRRVGARA